MEQIRISAKNLGQIMLPNFCQRCFWIKLKVNNKIPWQIFPVVFYSIDAYTKSCVKEMIKLGFMNKYKINLPGLKVPGWGKFNTVVKKYNILLTGIPDDVFTCDEGLILPDYKTAKYTENQDKLIPMYRVQLNGYAIIADDFYKKSVIWLPLIYFQPITDLVDLANINAAGDGFRMAFDPYIVNIEIDRQLVMDCMEQTREIYEMKQTPDSRDGCKDCEAIENIFDCVNPPESEG